MIIRYAGHDTSEIGISTEKKFRKFTFSDTIFSPIFSQCHIFVERITVAVFLTQKRAYLNRSQWGRKAFRSRPENRMPILRVFDLKSFL